MSAFSARCYDGQQAVARPATIEFRADERVAVIAVEGRETLRAAFEEIVVEPPLGRTARRVRLAGGGFLEVEDSPEFRAAAASVRPGGWMHLVSAAETRRSAIVCGVAVVVAVVVLVVKFGVPIAAESVASKLPPEVLDAVSDQAMATLDRAVFDPTEIPDTRQREIREGFARRAEAVSGLPGYRIEFRSGMGSPNAFALPSGAVIVTDEMVEFAESDDELHAVIAHELGHVHHRHGMRLVLQQAGIALLLSFFLGDVSSTLTAAGALPVMLVESGYSRGFETEADDYALWFCRETGLGPEPYAALFERLKGEGSELPAWFSSHPNLDDRVRRARESSPGP